MLVVAFTGNKGSGKTIAADYLVRKYGFVKVNFKDAIVIELLEKFPELLNVVRSGYMLDKIEDLFNTKPYVPEIRALFREYGTNVMREMEPGYWVNKWEEMIDMIEGNQVVVDDCRFINEFNIIKRYSGTVIRIVRPCTNNDSDRHPSELEMDKIKPDHTIYNKDTISNFLGKVERKMK